MDLNDIADRQLSNAEKYTTGGFGRESRVASLSMSTVSLLRGQITVSELSFSSRAPSKLSTVIITRPHISMLLLAKHGFVKRVVYIVYIMLSAAKLGA
jgi:hypothetical protein